MPFYREHVYHYLVAALGNPKLVQTIRQQLIPVAEGTSDTLSLIKTGGVTIEQTGATYLAPFPKPGSYFSGYGTSREAEIRIRILSTKGELCDSR